MELSWAADPLVMTIVLATGALKVAGGLFALALVRQAWPRPPRWIMIFFGWAASFVLVAYGVVQGGLQALVAFHLIDVPAEFDWYALRWHLYLWSPVFIIWGILLALAVRHYQTAGGTREKPAMAC